MSDGFAMPPPRKPVAGDKKKGKKKKKLALFEAPPWSTAPAGAAAQAVIEVVSAEGTVVKTLPIGTRRCTVVGRLGDVCDEVVDEPSASRKHLAVAYSGAERQFYLMDLKSANGTFLNGRPIPALSRIPLDNKDSIRIGDGTSVLRVSIGAIEQVATAPQGGSRAASAGAGAGDGAGPAGRVRATKAGKRVGADDSEDGDALLSPDELRAQLPTAFGGGVAGKEQRGMKRPADDMHDAFKRMAGGKKVVLKKARVGDDEQEDNDGDNSGSDSDDGPQPNAGAGGGSGAGAAAGVSESDLEDKADELDLPVSHEVMLKGHQKTVTALAFDPAGSRLITGSLDYGVRMYDFGGMDRSRRAFRTLTPEDGYGVVSLSFSPSGDKFVVATGSAKLKVFDRDGAKIIGTLRGDMYLHDPTRTPGHTHPNTGVQWHPRDKERFMSCGSDGTIRFWNLSGKTTFDELHSDQVIRVKNTRGLRTSVSAARFTKKGKSVFCVEESGTLQWFGLNTHGRYHRPDGIVKGAHENGGASSLTLSPDNRTLVSRGRHDETMKVWDVRKCSEPVLTYTGLPNLYDTTGVTFRPDGRLVMTAIGVPLKSNEPGQVRVFDLKSAAEGDMESAYSINVAQGASAVCMFWHPKIKHIAVGCADGATRLFYNPKKSKNGVMISNARAPKKRTMSDYVRPSTIHNPNALPMYQKDPTGHAERVALRKDPIRTKRPEMGSAGPMKRDKIKTTSFAQFVRKSKLDNKHLEEDPREALLKYAQQASDKPQWVDVAYTATQPDNIFTTKTLEEEEAAKKKIRDGIVDSDDDDDAY